MVKKVRHLKDLVDGTPLPDGLWTILSVDVGYRKVSSLWVIVEEPEDDEN